MNCQKTLSVNELDRKKGGVDLNKEYHFRRASGNPVPGETDAHRQDPGVFDQPDHTSRADYLRPLQESLAGGIVFQVDQTASSHQTVLRHVLVATVRKRLDLEVSLYTMLQIFSVMPFEKITLQQALTINQRSSEQMNTGIQLNLFEF